MGAPSIIIINYKWMLLFQIPYLKLLSSQNQDLIAIQKSNTNLYFFNVFIFCSHHILAYQVFGVQGYGTVMEEIDNDWDFLRVPNNVTLAVHQ